MTHAMALDLRTNDEPTPTTGGRLVATDGRTLPLRGASVAAEAGAGVARVILTQRFENPYPEPLQVTYLVPLPSDGAVAGFSFRIDGRRVVGEIDRRAQARERFEQALVEGRTAALLEQDRSSLFTQEVGNIPPRAKVEVEIEIDQRLRWLADGAWEWRFPTVVGARYLGEPGRVADAERVVVDVAEHGVSARVGLALTIGDHVTGGVESSSHSLVVDRGEKTRAVLKDGAALDRDLVVRWTVAAPEVGVAIQVARPASPDHEGASYGLLTLVPPSAKPRPVARDLIFLIDVSGSMSGEPLDQVKRIGAAMIDTLGPEDRVELIAFGNTPVRFAKEPLAATRDGKRAALAWLKALRASGATEMKQAVIEALRPLRPGSQRQVVLMTDGYIGFERELVGEVLARLPEGARLHTVGVGSAVNRTLTQWAARAGNGVEVICGLGEDPERVAARLLARTSAPLVTNVAIEGDALRRSAPARVPDLYAGSPSLISLELASTGGSLVVRGTMAGGEYVQRIDVPPRVAGEGLSTVTTLFGRERVEDLETEAAAVGSDAGIDREIEALGLRFRIATRLTSWIAVSDEVTVDPDAEKRRVRQPHEVPHGVSIEGLGLRAPAPAFGAPTQLTQAGTITGSFNLKELMSLESAPAAPMASAPPPLVAPAPAVKSRFESAPVEVYAAQALPRRSASRAWLWILITVLVLALAAIGAWLALSSGEPPPPENPTPAEAAPRE